MNKSNKLLDMCNELGITTTGAVAQAISVSGAASILNTIPKKKKLPKDKKKKLSPTGFRPDADSAA